MGLVKWSHQMDNAALKGRDAQDTNIWINITDARIAQEAPLPIAMAKHAVDEDKYSGPVTLYQ